MKWCHMFMMLAIVVALPTAAWAEIVPTDLSDCVFWIDANDINGDGETDSLADGTSITTWVDKSVSANDASVVDTGREPVLSLNAVNGLAALTFSGDYLETVSQIITGTGGRTIIAVARADSTNTNEALLALGGFGNTPKGSVYTFTSEIAVRVNGYIQYEDSLVGDGFAIAAVANGGNEMVSDIQGYLNGESMAVAGFSDATLDTLGDPEGVDTDGRSYIGASHNVSSFLHGQIAELIVYDRELSSAEMDQVNGYLSSKYAIDVVPEPGTFAMLVAAGLLAFIWQRRRV